MRAAKKQRHYRTLFMDERGPSKEALSLLERADIRFSKALISPESTDPSPNHVPLLITDEGQWEGLEAIQRYVTNTLKWGEA